MSEARILVTIEFVGQAASLPATPPPQQLILFNHLSTPTLNDFKDQICQEIGIMPRIDGRLYLLFNATKPVELTDRSLQVIRDNDEIMWTVAPSIAAAVPVEITSMDS
mmetsp:Transcript_35715/g.86302  ORF Transcript_35715/g.86302 Transcript_35715/m.86302 type:complete len:108 (-) Transcript_35715:403-726(-)